VFPRLAVARKISTRLIHDPRIFPLTRSRFPLSFQMEL
jgi:hypothetical protein